MAACKKVPAKTWEGNIQLGAITAGNGAYYFFRQNGCNWNGMDQLNGLDAYWFDVSGYGGLPGAFTWTTDSPHLSGNLTISFFDDKCTPLAGQYSLGAQKMGTNLPFLFAPSAKWAVITAQTSDVPATDLQVQMKSPGKACKRKKHH
jgi:hypothetical protein